MKDHWQSIGYTPDSEVDLEDEIDLEVDIQVGKNHAKGLEKWVQILVTDIMH